MAMISRQEALKRIGALLDAAMENGDDTAAACYGRAYHAVMSCRVKGNYVNGGGQKKSRNNSTDK